MKKHTLPKAVLFDLDGTLLNTSPDFIFAINSLRSELGMDAIAESVISPWVSKGGAAMVRAGFGELSEALAAERLKRFLQIYRENLCVKSHYYDGVEALLVHLEGHQIPWAIVTNKPAWLAEPLLDQLGLTTRAASIVCGDTLPVRKPDPAPVHLACEQIGVESKDTWFVGDDERDVQAGRAANCMTVLAAYGYIGSLDVALTWGADMQIDCADELIGLLQQQALSA